MATTITVFCSVPTHSLSHFISLIVAAQRNATQHNAFHPRLIIN